MILDALGERWFEDRTQPEPWPLFKDESSWRPIEFPYPVEATRMTEGNDAGDVAWLRRRTDALLRDVVRSL